VKAIATIRTVLFALALGGAVAVPLVEPSPRLAHAATVTLDPAVIAAHNALLTQHNADYLIFALDGSRVRLESTGARTNPYSYEKFRAAMVAKKEPRFAVIEYRTQLADNRFVQKIVLILWAPDASNLLVRMRYAAATNEIKRQLAGIAKFTQASDAAGLAESAIKALVLQ
jgi:Cofilin/tropomyosin-type actin-binding protein